MLPAARWPARKSLLTAYLTGSTAIGCGLARTASAAWGSEGWGEMVWGDAASVPAIGLWGLVLLGFSRTFFLRPWIETYPVHVSVLWHGVAVTAWFVWYPMQSLLVARREVALHRRLGWGGAAIGTAAASSKLTLSGLRATALSWPMTR